ncbi:ATP-binding protein [Streptomyces mobaraensis]|uniref:ATP-binding protein n=1 Tax=Streptomyces mobaraensis TaxID=35621 RepID=UPI0033E53811
MRVLRVRAPALIDADERQGDATHSGYPVGPYPAYGTVARLFLMEHTTVITNVPPVVRRWPRHPCSVRRAREALRTTLRRWRMGAVEDAAVLVLSELMTNAVVHARVSPGRQVATRFTSEGRRLHLQVEDADRRWSDLSPRGGEGGRGLLLVEALSQQWGVSERNGVGKSVWALLEVPAEGMEG